MTASESALNSLYDDDLERQFGETFDPLLAKGVTSLFQGEPIPLKQAQALFTFSKSLHVRHPHWVHPRGIQAARTLLDQFDNGMSDEPMSFMVMESSLPFPLFAPILGSGVSATAIAHFSSATARYNGLLNIQATIGTVVACGHPVPIGPTSLLLPYRRLPGGEVEGAFDFTVVRASPERLFRIFLSGIVRGHNEFYVPYDDRQYEACVQKSHDPAYHQELRERDTSVWVSSNVKYVLSDGVYSPGPGPVSEWLPTRYTQMAGGLYSTREYTGGWLLPEGRAQLDRMVVEGASPFVIPRRKLMIPASGSLEMLPTGILDWHHYPRR